MNTNTNTTTNTIKPGTIRWLSSLGLPGFGRQTAKLAHERMTVLGVSAHVAVFGGVELDRARYFYAERTGERAGC